MCGSVQSMAHHRNDNKTVVGKTCRMSFHVEVFIRIVYPVMSKSKKSRGVPGSHTLEWDDGRSKLLIVSKIIIIIIITIIIVAFLRTGMPGKSKTCSQEQIYTLRYVENCMTQSYRELRETGSWWCGWISVAGTCAFNKKFSVSKRS